MSTDLRVMHVEDDPDILSVVNMSLTLLGEFEMTQFTSGADAVAAADSVRCDLLLLDLMLPGMDGLETLARLREFPHFATTPAVLFTAKLHDLPDAESAGTRGIIGTIRKPFDAATLPGQIQTLWEQSIGALGRPGQTAVMRARI